MTKRNVGRPATPKDHVVCYERNDGTYAVLNGDSPLTRTDALALCNDKNRRKTSKVKSYFVRAFVPAHVQVNKTTMIVL
jgi:hypothetical protein